MTSTHTNSIALLIDADNAPSGKIDFILSELAGHGVVNIRRAYGNWTKPALSGWIKVLQENSIQPMQSFDIVKVETGLQAKQNLKGNAKLMTTLRNAVSATADEEGWANLSNIANRINNESPLDHRTYGFKKLVDLFEAIDLFDVTREKNGTHNVISIRIAKVGGKKVKPKPVTREYFDDVDDDDIPF